MTVNDIIFPWYGNHADIPVGWERYTPLDNKFPKASGDESAEATGGNEDHSHSSAAHLHVLPDHTHTGITNSVAANANTSNDDTTKELRESHTHGYTSSTTGGGSTETTALTYSAISNNPPNDELIFIKSSLKTLPNNGIILWNQVDAPTNTDYKVNDGNNSTVDLNNKYLKSAPTEGNAGNPGGSTENVHGINHGHTPTNHTHTSTSGNPNNSQRHAGPSGSNAVYAHHNHTVSLGGKTQAINSYVGDLTTAETVEPAYKMLMAYQNKAGSAQEIPMKTIAMTIEANIPGGWQLCDGDNETPDLRNKFIKITINSGNIGNTGGSNDHAHASQNHTHGTGAAHLHSASVSAHVNEQPTEGGGAAVVKAGDNHASKNSDSTSSAYNAGSTTANSSSNEPEYVILRYIERIAEQTITAKANIFTASNQTIQAKGSILKTSSQTITAKARIEKLFTQTITAKATIQRLLTQTITTKANIFTASNQTIQAKGNFLETSNQTITAKGRITTSLTQTITAKARIYGAFPTEKIMVSKARINPSQLFIDETEKTVRQIGAKLEIQWDGVSWTDESIYLLNAQANEKLAKTSGEGIASTMDVELDNTDERFTPGNTSSPIYAYIKPKVPIRISVVMGGYAYKLFTGYIKNIHPSTRNRVCSLECFDNQTLVYDKRANGIVYEDYRSDELLSTLAVLAGLTSGQYEFDIGTLIVNFGYFEDRNVWPIMGEIAVAERGRVFFDRRGILRFWNRNRLHNQSSLQTLTLNDWISDLDYSVSEHEIKNTVIVKAMPRASAGIQVVWTSGNAEYLNPYTDTLVWIPAGESQVAWLELEDPCTIFISPIKDADFTANSEQDGSGIDLTDNIEIHEFINYGNAVFITVGNIGDTDAYLTKFNVRGNPAQVLKWIKVTAKEESSIDRYGSQEFEIENNFIQSEYAASEIADEELWRRKDAVNLFKISIIGIPYILCGDVVNIEHRTGLYKEYMIDQLNWILDDNGFNQKLVLVNPYIFPIIQRISARGYIVKYHQIKTATAKANILPTKLIQAKGDIEAAVSRTMIAVANIT